MAIAGRSTGHYDQIELLILRMLWAFPSFK